MSDLYRFVGSAECGHQGCNEADLQFAVSYGMVKVEPASRITVTEESATYLDVSVLEHGRYAIVRLGDE